MKSEDILRSSLNDLLFENRNKMYGAYVLRRDYPLHVRRALASMLALSAAFVLLSFVRTGKKAFIPLAGAEGHVLCQIRPHVPVTPPTPKRKAAAPPTAKFVSAILFTADTDSSDRRRDISRLAIGVVNIPDDPFAADEPALVPVVPAVPVPEMPPVAPPQAGVGNEPVTDPDVQPAYPGGQQALLAFLQKNLQMPLPLEPGEAVQVQVKFVVGFDGELQTFAVQKDGGPAFNDEVIRVLKRMPRWVPGKKGSRAVAAYYSLPVKFTGDE